MNTFHSSWFYWAIGVALGFPAGVIMLTELHHTLVRRNSRLAGQVGLLRNLLLPLGALLLVLLLSGLNATVFEGAPEDSWRKRLPTIFVDVARFALIGVGVTLILSVIWGVRINDWLDTSSERGRVVEVNWRAVHIQTGTGTRITPNSVLASNSFTNLSRPPGTHKLTMKTTFSTADAPDQVCALLARVASALPQLKAGSVPRSVPPGAASTRRALGCTHRPTTARRDQHFCGGSGTPRGGRNCTSTTPMTTTRRGSVCSTRCAPWWRR
jgi:Mechanosensitive ion channel